MDRYINKTEFLATIKCRGDSGGLVGLVEVFTPRDSARARSSWAASCQVELASKSVGPAPSFVPAPAPGFASLFATDKAHAPDI